MSENLTQDTPTLPKPTWLRTRISTEHHASNVNTIVSKHGLHTVCQSAHCPNIGECWKCGTATFMINGDICTRNCTFCAVSCGHPQPLDPDEPKRLADAAAAMNLRYVVVTSVTRDDLPDGGASAFAQTILELRKQIPNVAIEVLIPDFHGNLGALHTVFEARPDILNHNIETVPRLYPTVRPQAEYQRSLKVLQAASGYGLTTKSGFMLGLGESGNEVEETLLDLKTYGCNIVTIGQYLRPSPNHHPLVRYATPDEFDHWRLYGENLGLSTVESGPLVRSSYHAFSSYRRCIDGNSQRYHES